MAIDSICDLRRVSLYVMGYRGKLEEESIVRTGQSSLVGISVYTHEIEEELIIARHFVLMVINALMEKEKSEDGWTGKSTRRYFDIAGESHDPYSALIRFPYTSFLLFISCLVFFLNVAFIR